MEYVEHINKVLDNKTHANSRTRALKIRRSAIFARLLRMIDFIDKYC